MTADFSIEEVDATHAAVIRATVTPRDIPLAIMPLVDRVWTFLRDSGVSKHGHNVWIYHDRGNGGVDVEVGVQVATPFERRGEVVSIETPSGRAAHAVHYGDYAQLPEVHAALRAWCATAGLSLTGDSWEVYGDFAEAPEARRTDVYHLIRSSNDGG